MTTLTPRLRLRILVFEELPGIWVGRALEHDVLAEGRTIQAAVQAVLRITRAHVEFDRRHNREPLSGFRSAPQAYWNAFTRAMPLAWASSLAGMLPQGAEVMAAVATERPRHDASMDAMNRAIPPVYAAASSRSARV